LHPRDQELSEGKRGAILSVRSQRPPQRLVVLGQGVLEVNGPAAQRDKGALFGRT
jgi:hypothetical protein